MQFANCSKGVTDRLWSLSLSQREYENSTYIVSICVCIVCNHNFDRSGIVPSPLRYIDGIMNVLHTLASPVKTEVI